MSKENPLPRYLTTSIFALAVSLCITFASFFLMRDIANNPVRYFLENVPPTVFHYYVVIFAGVVASIAISIVVYVILLTNNRIDLAVWNATRWLATSREQFRRIYESAPIPYIMITPDGLMHEPNKAALRFFGLLPEEIEGQNLFSFYSSDTPERIAQLTDLYNRNVPINREEVQITTKGGAKKWVSLSVFEMKNATTSTSSGLATLFDITEEKLLDKTKTEFVSLASHQLRTPLATTKWFMDMLRGNTLGDMNPKQKEYIDRIYAVNENMIGLVDTLLNVSRIDMGTLPIAHDPTNVREIAESILDELAPQITKKNLQIQKQFDGKLEAMPSDPKLLRIVLHNLLTNSVKYTPENGTIAVIFDESGTTKRISVSDNGLGIPKAQQDRIFTKMFRADNVVKIVDSESSGLGLYLVKSIVERMGGDISFVSEEGKGTAFTITL